MATRPRHRWTSQDDPVAFMRCLKCGLEHTVGNRIGRAPPLSYFCRRPGGEWEQYRTPPPCEPFAAGAPRPAASRRRSGTSVR